MNKFAPLHPKVSTLLHGADYNPEQWENDPDIIDKDIAMMQQAKCNVMSVGIFSWAKLEPREGVFNFAWLDIILDKLYAAGIHVFLATPSGARPAWMSQRYPQVLRVGRDRVPALHGGRHNHCMSSPVYREKTLQINTLLAERYSSHPAVLGWHISNEYGGECHWRTSTRPGGAPSGVIPILTGRRLNRLRRRARCRSTVSILTGIALTPLR